MGGMGGFGFPGGAAGGFDVGGLFDAMFGGQTSRGPCRGCVAAPTRWRVST